MDTEGKDPENGPNKIKCDPTLYQEALERTGNSNWGDVYGDGLVTPVDTLEVCTYISDLITSTRSVPW